MAVASRTSTDDVFINCPFDADYGATFRALIFTIYACGFRPRSARELDDGSQARIEKLLNIIDECRYGIHGHGGDPERAMAETRDWLANVSRRKLPSGTRIIRIYRRFLADLPAIAEELEFDPDGIPYVDFERIVVSWLMESPDTI